MCELTHLIRFHRNLPVAFFLYFFHLSENSIQLIQFHWIILSISANLLFVFSPDFFSFAFTYFFNISQMFDWLFFSYYLFFAKLVLSKVFNHIFFLLLHIKRQFVWLILLGIAIIHCYLKLVPCLINTLLSGYFPYILL